MPSFWPALLHLPKGHLTTVLRPNGGGCRSDWATIVGRLILDLIETRQPVVYMRAGLPDGPGPARGFYETPDRFLNVLDVHAAADDVRVRRSRWSAGKREPEWGTVDALRHGAGLMDGRFGPAALILDNGNDATVGIADGAAAPWSETDTRGASEGRRSRGWADQLAELARSRPESPTIVVWSLDDSDDVTSHVLADASLATIHVQKVLPWGEVPMYVRTRAAVDADWSAPRFASPDVLDWGLQ